MNKDCAAAGLGGGGTIRERRDVQRLPRGRPAHVLVLATVRLVEVGGWVCTGLAHTLSLSAQASARAARYNYKKCVLGWVFRHCGVGTPIDPHDLLRSLRWTPVGVGPQPGYTRRLGKQ